MKIIRYIFNNNIEYGVQESDVIYKIEGDVFSDYRVTDSYRPVSEIKYLTPTEPSKIIAVGLNYKDHVKEMGEKLPKSPLIFMKPSTAAVSHGNYIIKPAHTRELSYEAELAIIIKKTAKNIKEEDARAYILGYTCLNDVTARDIQREDGQWTRAKGFDTFAPIGPCISTDIEPDNLDLKLILNGEIKQSSNTADFIFKTDYLVSFISQIMTLMPGDIITTGTPAGIGLMKSGDEVCVEIENIGRLTNIVKG